MQIFSTFQIASIEKAIVFHTYFGAFLDLNIICNVSFDIEGRTSRHIYC